jgi:outer membrane protein assembly factor BamB
LGQGSGSKIWEFNSGAPVEASALYFENTVYAGNHDGALYAIDAETGKEKWKYTAESKITASANYAKISGSRTLILVGSFDNFMHAVDAETGKLVWKYATKSYINGTPAVDKGILAFGGCDSFLRILDANEGNETACFKMGSYIASSVCFFGDDIYLAHYGGNVVCVSLQQSKILWQYPKDSSLEAFQGSPAVNSEKVVVGCQDFNVYSPVNCCGRSKQRDQ